MSIIRIAEITKLVKSTKGGGAVPILLSSPGSGKTCIAEQIAASLGLQFISLRIGEMDFSEVVGLYDRMPDGTVDLRPQRWAKMANEKPSLVFFDEVNRANIQTLNATMQVWSERRLGWNFKFNDDVYFLAAGNLGEEDDTIVNEMDAAQWNRLVPIKIDVKHPEWIQQWLDWAKDKVYKKIVSFIEKRPEFLFHKGSDNENQFATARSWTNFSKFLFNNEVNEDNIMELSSIFAGLYIGSTNALTFIRFLEEERAITAKDIIERYDTIKEVVEKMSKDKISELIQVLKETNPNELAVEKQDNIKKFLRQKNVSKELVVSYVSGLSIKWYTQEKTKEETKEKNPFIYDIAVEYKDIFTRFKPSSNSEEEPSAPEKKERKKKNS